MPFETSKLNIILTTVVFLCEIAFKKNNCRNTY